MSENSNFTVVTGQATKWAADITVNDCKKYGKVCSCNISAQKATGTLTAGEALFSLPWGVNVVASGAFYTVVGRNTTSGASGAISVKINPDYNTVSPVVNYSEYNQVLCYLTYLTQ